MAVAYCRTATLSRSAGYNMTRKAAYNARECLRDKDGHTYDYSHYQRDELVTAEIFAPEYADPRYQDRETLWQEVERLERRKDSQLAREQIIALPHELSQEQQKEVMRRYCQVLVERYGVVVDLAIHRPGPKSNDKNIHAHVLFTTRRIDKETGTLGDKIEVLRNPAKSGQELQILRQKFQEIVNQYLPPDKQIDMRSYEAQGSDRPAQLHLGKNRVGRERRTGQKDEFRQNYEERLRRWEENQAIKKCVNELLPQAHQLNLPGVKKENDQYFWDVKVFPAKNCRELVPLLEQALQKERQRLEQELSTNFKAVYKQAQDLSQNPDSFIRVDGDALVIHSHLFNPEAPPEQTCLADLADFLAAPPEIANEGLKALQKLVEQEHLRLEQERLQLERQRQEQERQEQERQRAEQERLRRERQRQEQERQEQERQRAEQERLRRERQEQLLHRFDQLASRVKAWVFTDPLLFGYEETSEKQNPQIQIRISWESREITLKRTQAVNAEATLIELERLLPLAQNKAVKNGIEFFKIVSKSVAKLFKEPLDLTQLKEKTAELENYNSILEFSKVAWESLLPKSEPVLAEIKKIELEIKKAETIISNRESYALDNYKTELDALAQELELIHSKFPTPREIQFASLENLEQIENELLELQAELETLQNKSDDLREKIVEITAEADANRKTKVVEKGDSLQTELNDLELEISHLQNQLQNYFELAQERQAELTNQEPEPEPDEPTYRWLPTDYSPPPRQPRQKQKEQKDFDWELE